MKLTFQQTVNPCSRCLFGYTHLTQKIMDDLYPNGHFKFFEGATECQNGDNYHDPFKHFSDTCESFVLNDLTGDEIIQL